MSAVTRVVRERIIDVAPKKNSIDELQSTLARALACQALKRASRSSSTPRDALRGLSIEEKAANKAVARYA
jgi:hypothetical protein